MKALVFFNEKLNSRVSLPLDPPLVIQVENTTRIQCHEIRINGPIIVKASSTIVRGKREGSREIPDYHVRAWIECWYEHIEILK